MRWLWLALSECVAILNRIIDVLCSFLPNHSTECPMDPKLCAHQKRERKGKYVVYEFNESNYSHSSIVVYTITHTHNHKCVLCSVLYLYEVLHTLRISEAAAQQQQKNEQIFLANSQNGKRYKIANNLFTSVQCMRQYSSFQFDRKKSKWLSFNFLFFLFRQF